MPRHLLSEYTVVHVVRDEQAAPPFIALTSDQSEATREALDWARATFGDGDYEVAGIEFRGRMQGRASWGTPPG